MHNRLINAAGKPSLKLIIRYFQNITVGTRSQICILGLRSYLITWICPRRRKRSDKPWNGGSHKEKGGRVQSEKVILLG